MELTDVPIALAELQERAGVVAMQAGRPKDAPRHYEEAIALFEREGRPRDVARVTGRFGDVAFSFGRLEEAATRMQQAFDVLSKDESDESLGNVAVHLARMLHFSGRTEEAFDRNERALEVGETLGLPEVLAEALNNKGIMLWTMGRRQEGSLLVKHALHVALGSEVYWAALRAYNNISALAYEADKLEEAIQVSQEGRDLSRKMGFRTFELNFLVGDVSALVTIGRWDEALARAAEFEASAEGIADSQFARNELIAIVELHARRGEFDEARQMLEDFAALGSSDEIQARTIHAVNTAVVSRAEGRAEEALRGAQGALEAKDALGFAHGAIKMAFIEAIEAALELGDVDKAERWVEELEAKRPQELTPFLRANTTRLRARIDATKGEHEGAEEKFKVAIDELRALPAPFWVAVTLLEHAEWLIQRGRSDEAGLRLDEAREIFQGLRAQPWLERASAALEQVSAQPASAAPA
jgi:tetratricopeptide (TPR) repeat protein